MAKVTEIAPDLFRISVFVPDLNMQFNHFLVRDDEPLLFHAGYRRMFPEVREALAGVINPEKLRWISFSHFESDECGALNEWLAVAPHAEAACGFVGAMVSVNDFAIRPARVMSSDEPLQTGKYKFRYFATPHIPHGWDAGVLFEETTATLLCSDLFHHNGDVDPVTTSDIVGHARETLQFMQAGPLANYVPFTPNTNAILQGLADLKPRLLATQHGSSFSGNGEQALRDLSQVMREVLNEESWRLAVTALK
jgi:flavorubredoxin